MVTLDVLFTGFFTAPRFRMTNIFFRGRITMRPDEKLPAALHTPAFLMAHTPGEEKRKDRPLFAFPAVQHPHLLIR